MTSNPDPNDANSPPDLPDEDESPAGEDSVTPRERANRKNAQKSTGPRTAEGKERSSQNAIRSGVFAGPEAIPRGVFAEDPDDLFQLTASILESLDPRDGIESMIANEIAGVMVKLGRLERWSAISIAGATKMGPAEFSQGARSETMSDVMAEVAMKLSYYLNGRRPAVERDFENFALFIRYHGPVRDVRVEGLWDDEHEPATLDQWQRVFDALMDHLWPRDEDAMRWADSKALAWSRESERVQGLEEEIAVRKLLNGPLDLHSRYQSRHLRSLETLLTRYDRLREREVD